MTLYINSSAIVFLPPIMGCLVGLRVGIGLAGFYMAGFKPDPDVLHCPYQLISNWDEFRTGYSTTSSTQSDSI